MSAPLWRRDPVGRFDGRARDYARWRPGYPPEAVDLVLAGLGDPASLVAADVGAGTGIFSRLLSLRGVKVTAVEPNPAMRERLEPAAGIAVREGRAERTGLADAAVRLVTCAQSFHWFEPGAALAEFRRILEPGGRLAVVWNERAEDDPFTAAWTRLMRETAAGGETEADRSGLEQRLLDAGFDGPVHSEFGNVQELDLEGVVGRALSTSYAPRSGPGHDLLLRGLRDLHASHRDGAGRVRLLYRTQVFLAVSPAFRR